MNGLDKLAASCNMSIEDLAESLPSRYDNIKDVRTRACYALSIMNVIVSKEAVETLCDARLTDKNFLLLVENNPEYVLNNAVEENRSKLLNCITKSTVHKSLDTFTFTEKAVSVNLPDFDSVLGSDVVNLTRTIRRIASYGIVQIDETTHSSNNGLNTHLFKFIEACHISVHDFVTSYLQHLQPYDVQVIERSDDKVVILLRQFKVYLYIKLVISEHEMLCVSFHESNIAGTPTCRRRNHSSNICVLLDVPYKEKHGLTSITYTVQVGFMIMILKCIASSVCDDVAIVSDSVAIDAQNQYVISELLRLGVYENVSAQTVTMSAFGMFDLNAISLCIDVYPHLKEETDRRALLSAMLLMLVQESKQNLNAVVERYSVSHPESLNTNAYKLLLTVKDEKGTE